MASKADPSLDMMNHFQDAAGDGDKSPRRDATAVSCDWLLSRARIVDWEPHGSGHTYGCFSSYSALL